MEDNSSRHPNTQEARKRLGRDILTVAAACLIGGRAARLLRLYQDRIGLEDLETLADLARSPYNTLIETRGAEDDVERLEQKFGGPNPGPNLIEKHAFDLLWAAYQEQLKDSSEALDESGLELIDSHTYEEGERVRIRDRSKAHAWFERALDEAIDSNGEDEDSEDDDAESDQSGAPPQ